METADIARAEALRQDMRERRCVEHTLQIAIQAALDVRYFRDRAKSLAW